MTFSRPPNTQAVQLINAALMHRNMLPMDGECSCGRCGRENLKRSQIAKAEGPSSFVEAVDGYGGQVCAQCLEIIWLDWEASTYGAVGTKQNVTCKKCRGKGDFGRVYDILREEWVTDWCEACNGY